MQNIITVGRRKTAVARIILKSGTGEIFINKKPLDQFFKVETLRHHVTSPFEVTSNMGKYDIQASVEGGGIAGQAEAIRLGVSRALVAVSEENRSLLRDAGFMTRDPRMVERKKYGQKKARKRFQFSKR